MSALKITFDKNNVIIGDFPKSLSFSNSDNIYKQIKNIIDKNNTKDIILDFEGLDYIDSSSIGKIIHISNILRYDKKFFAIINIKKHILKIFESFRLNKLFYLTQNEDVQKNTIYL